MHEAETVGIVRSVRFFVKNTTDFAIGIVIFAPFPSGVVTKVRTARRATGVSVSIGCNPAILSSPRI